MARLADPDLAERRRVQILDAARQCFRRKGFHQATMQEICVEAGISAGALYRYFNSKSDIIAAIAEMERGEAERGFLQAASNHALVDALCMIMEKFLQKIQSAGEGNMFADVCAEAARDPILSRRLAEIDAAGIRRFADVIERAQRRGEVDSELDPAVAAQTLSGAMEGLALRNSFLSESSPLNAVARFRLLATRYLAVQS